MKVVKIQEIQQIKFRNPGMEEAILFSAGYGAPTQDAHQHPDARMFRLRRESRVEVDDRMNRFPALEQSHLPHDLHEPEVVLRRQGCEEGAETPS